MTSSEDSKSWRRRTDDSRPLLCGCSPDKMLKDLFQKVVEPGERKNMAAYLMESYTVVPPSLPGSQSAQVHVLLSNGQEWSASDWQAQRTGRNEGQSQGGQDKLYERIRSEGILSGTISVRRVYLKMVSSTAPGPINAYPVGINAPRFPLAVTSAGRWISCMTPAQQTAVPHIQRNRWL